MTKIDRRTRGTRALLMTGTASAMALVAAAAQAQTATPTVQQSSQSDIVYRAPLLEGGPSVLALESQNGSITADVTTVRSTNSGTADNTIVQLETNGTGGINGTFGTITAAGNGDAQGLEADTDTADIVLRTGTIDLSGGYTRGILAESNSGNVTVNAGSTFTRGTNLRAGDDSPGEGILVMTGGRASVTANVTEAYGQFASAIVASGDAGVDVTSTRAFAKSDSVTVLYGRSARGDVSVASTAVEGAATTGVTLIAGVADAGNVTVRSGTAQSAATRGSALAATATNGTATVTSDKIAMTGANALGISARGNQIAITSREAVTGGNAIVATGTGTGANAAAPSTVSVQTTGATTSTNGSGIRALGTNVSVATGADSSTSGSVLGILAQGVTVSVRNGGTTSGTGTALYGIQAVNTAAGGRVDVTSNRVALEGAASQSTAISAGIFASSGAATPITIDSGTVTTGGANAYGIYVTGSGATTLTSAAITNQGVNRAGIRVVGGAGPVAVTSGTIDLASATSAGIFVTSGSDITIGSTRITQTGQPAQTQTTPAAGIFASSGGTAGRIAITSDAITTSGLNAHGINAVGGGDITVTSNTVTTGALAVGIIASSRSGNVAVRSGAVTLGGTGGAGIQAIAGAGTVAVTSGTVTGANAGGIIARGALGTSVTSGSVTIGGGAITAVSSNGDTTVATTGDTVSQRAGGIYASGRQVTVSTAANTTTSGAGAGIDVIANDGATVTNAGTVAATAADAAAIRIAAPGPIALTSNAVRIDGTGATGIALNGQDGRITAVSDSITGTAANQTALSAFSNNGAIAVTSRDVAVGGTSAMGINVSSNGGAVTVNAGRTISSGTGFDEATGQTGEAIVAYSGTGTVSITSREASAAGLYASAVAAYTGSTRVVGGDVTITSTTAGTTGDLGVAVYGVSRGGNVAITSGTVTTTGANTLAIQAFASAGTATVGADSVSATGATSRGVSADGTGVTLTARDVAATGTAITARARTTAVAATLTGTISSSGATAFEAQGPQVTLDVASTGRLSGATQGVAITAGGAATITNAGSITGTATGITFDGGALTNTGTIASTNGAAITATGAARIVNAGVLSGGAGVAAQLGDGDDRVELRSGSVVTGRILAGGGTDVLALAGSGTATSAAEKLATFGGFERLDVLSGYWTADQGTSDVALVTVANGATLRLNEVSIDGQRASPVTAAAIANNGRLVIDARTTASTGDLNGLAVSGTGAVDFVGTGRFVADSNALTYTGPTTVSNGTLVLVGNLPGTLIVNQGGTVRLGAGDARGTLGGDVLANGTFVYDRSDSYAITGKFDGTGSLVKNGAGTLTFAGGYSFNGTTTVNAGGLRIAGAIDPTSSVNVQGGTVDLSAASMPVVAGLSGGSGGTLALGSNTLTVNQADNSAFAGALTGDGALVKSGSGRLNVTGTSSFTGTTTVSGGTLAVNGSLANSQVNVGSGGTLGGNGTIGGATLQSGGVFAPGNSIGRTNVAGNVTFVAGSIYQVEVNAAGQSDQVAASGRAILQGGTVQVLADASTRYRGRTDYTILTAAGGVTGTFAGATSNLAFLTPTLSYGANAVGLTLTRNNVAFASVATTGNQRAVAGALQALGGGNTLFEETLFLSDTGARRDFDALSGEYHADVDAVVIADQGRVRDALLAQPAASGEGLHLWAFGVGGRLFADTAASGAAARRGTIAGLAGIGYGKGGFDAGIGGGKGHSDINVPGLGSSGGIDSDYVAAYAGYRAGGLALRIGGSHAWHDVDGQRGATIGTLGGIVRSAYDAKTWQVFGEAGYALGTGLVAVEPYAGIAYVRQQSDRFAETGGVTALTVAAAKRDATFSTAGLRVSGQLASVDGVAFSPRIAAAWRHGWGDLTGYRQVAFTGTTNSFTVTGTALPRDLADVKVGFDIEGGPARLSLGYVGTIGSRWRDHGLNANVTIRF